MNIFPFQQWSQVLSAEGFWITGVSSRQANASLPCVRRKPPRLPLETLKGYPRNLRDREPIQRKAYTWLSTAKAKWRLHLWGFKSLILTLIFAFSIFYDSLSGIKPPVFWHLCLVHSVLTFLIRKLSFRQFDRVVCVLIIILNPLLFLDICVLVSAMISFLLKRFSIWDFRFEFFFPYFLFLMQNQRFLCFRVGRWSSNFSCEERAASFSAPRRCFERLPQKCDAAQTHARV